MQSTVTHLDNNTDERGDALRLHAPEGPSKELLEARAKFERLIDALGHTKEEVPQYLYYAALSIDPDYAAAELKPYGADYSAGLIRARLEDYSRAILEDRNDLKLTLDVYKRVFESAEPRSRVLALRSLMSRSKSRLCVETLKSLVKERVLAPSEIFDFLDNDEKLNIPSQFDKTELDLDFRVLEEIEDIFGKKVYRVSFQTARSETGPYSPLAVATLLRQSPMSFYDEYLNQDLPRLLPRISDPSPEMATFQRVLKIFLQHRKFYEVEEIYRTPEFHSVVKMISLVSCCMTFKECPPEFSVVLDFALKDEGVRRELQTTARTGSKFLKDRCVHSVDMEAIFDFVNIEDPKVRQDIFRVIRYEIAQAFNYDFSETPLEYQNVFHAIGQWCRENKSAKRSMGATKSALKNVLTNLCDRIDETRDGREKLSRNGHSDITSSLILAKFYEAMIPADRALKLSNMLMSIDDVDLGDLSMVLQPYEEELREINHETLWSQLSDLYYLEVDSVYGQLFRDDTERALERLQKEIQKKEKAYIEAEGIEPGEIHGFLVGLKRLARYLPQESEALLHAYLLGESREVWSDYFFSCWHEDVYIHAKLIVGMYYRDVRAATRDDFASFKEEKQLELHSKLKASRWIITRDSYEAFEKNYPLLADARRYLLKTLKREAPADSLDHQKQKVKPGETSTSEFYDQLVSLREAFAGQNLSAPLKTYVRDMITTFHTLKRFESGKISSFQLMLRLQEIGIVGMAYRGDRHTAEMPPLVYALGEAKGVLARYSTKVLPIGDRETFVDAVSDTILHHLKLEQSISFAGNPAFPSSRARGPSYSERSLYGTGWPGRDQAAGPFAAVPPIVSKRMGSVSRPLSGHAAYLIDSIHVGYDKKTLTYPPLGAGSGDYWSYELLKRSQDVQVENTVSTQFEFYNLTHGSKIALPWRKQITAVSNSLNIKNPLRRGLDGNYYIELPSHIRSIDLTVTCEIPETDPLAKSISLRELTKRLKSKALSGLLHTDIALSEYPEPIRDLIAAAKAQATAEDALSVFMSRFRQSYLYDLEVMLEAPYRKHIRKAPYENPKSDHQAAAIHSLSTETHLGRTVCSGSTHLAVHAMRHIGIPTLYATCFSFQNRSENDLYITTRNAHAVPVAMLLDTQDNPLFVPIESTPYATHLGKNSDDFFVEEAEGEDETIRLKMPATVKETHTSIMPEVFRSVWQAQLAEMVGDIHLNPGDLEFLSLLLESINDGTCETHFAYLRTLSGKVRTRLAESNQIDPQTLYRAWEYSMRYESIDTFRKLRDLSPEAPLSEKQRTLLWRLSNSVIVKYESLPQVNFEDLQFGSK